LKAINQGQFANVLGYHARYFKAQAFWHLGSAKYADADKNGKAMNVAVAYLKESV